MIELIVWSFNSKLYASFVYICNFVTPIMNKTYIVQFSFSYFLSKQQIHSILFSWFDTMLTNDPYNAIFYPHSSSETIASCVSFSITLLFPLSMHYDIISSHDQKLLDLFNNLFQHILFFWIKLMNEWTGFYSYSF